jgi:hypothetical protein
MKLPDNLQMREHSRPRRFHIINVTTTELNTRKKIFEFGQREVISFFTLVTNKGEHSIIYSK